MVSIAAEIVQLCDVGTVVAQILPRCIVQCRAQLACNVVQVLAQLDCIVYAEKHRNKVPINRLCGGGGGVA